MPRNHPPQEDRDAGAEPLRLCRTVDDVYLKSGRDAIFHCIPSFFETHKLSVIELMHCTEWVTVLENSDLTLQAIIQRTALRLQHLMPGGGDAYSLLDQLAQKAIRQLWVDTGNNLFPDIANAADFAGLAGSLGDSHRPGYILNGAIARRLHKVRDVNEKICLLISMLDGCRESAPGWTLLHRAVDEILCELIRLPETMQALAEPVKDFGDLLLAHARLFLSLPPRGVCIPGKAIDLLAWHFAIGDLPQTHIMLGIRLQKGIASRQSLCEGSVREEMLRFKQLGRLIVQCIGPHLKRRDIQPDLDLRSSRLASPERIHDCLSLYALPDRKVKKLFFIESCIVDARSRYHLADMIFRMATSANFRQQFETTQELLIDRLHRLADLYRCALGSNFDEDQRQKLAAIFDHLAHELALKGRLFENIDQRYANIAQRTVTIARLYYDGHITGSGLLARMGRKWMMEYTRLPGFLEAYIAYRSQRDGRSLDRHQALIDIGIGMKRVGIDPEIALYRVVR